ncbi:MAG TPA: DDE-type integrase/transposase/recombinase [Nitrososphaeraceae archaeon]|nr:DDE-type integrase/transposase/recombinase [Nitrososphaeraceae archaeon]
MECKYCQGENVVKHGKRFNIQRYLCKDCQHKFYDNNKDFAKMRNDPKIIVSSLNAFYNGLSMRSIAEQINDIFGVKVSHSTIHYWIHKYAKFTKDYVESLTPVLSGKYHHDETELKVHGTGRYFWQTLDEDTRYIVAHLLSADRTTNNAIQVFQQALQKQRPKVLFTDGSYSYDNAFRKVYGTRYKDDRVKWIRRIGIRKRQTNNIVERSHSTLKSKIRTCRGLKNDKSSAELLDGYVINYNFCRKHSVIKTVPCKKAKIEIEGWNQLIREAQIYSTKQDKQLELKVTAK